ncbi:TPA: hypothetical protein ACINU0_000631 [Streptococcus agalactiae]
MGLIWSLIVGAIIGAIAGAITNKGRYGFDSFNRRCDYRYHCYFICIRQKIITT